MKCRILRMADVHAHLFQFKFFYSLNVSGAKSFLFRYYTFRNPTVTFQVCPRSNFPLKYKILHAGISSVTFSDVWQNCLLAEGMKKFHTQCQDCMQHTGLQSTKGIKCKYFLLWISFKLRPPKFCTCPLPCNYHFSFSTSLLFYVIGGTQPATCGATV